MQNQPPITGNVNPASNVPTGGAEPPVAQPQPAPQVAQPAQPGATPSSAPVNPLDVAQGAMPDPLDMPSGSVVAPVAPQPFGPSAPGTVPNFGSAAVTSTPDPAPATPPRKPVNRNLIETIILVVVSIVAMVFIGLFIWKYIEWDSVKTDVDGQIDAAVAMAVAENTTKLENEFTEREKYPYKSFMGPSDYGSLSFEYPKTWNIYVAKDASNGGDYEAYLNPGEVQPVSATTINALRVTIRDQAFDNVTRTYDSLVRTGKLSVVSRNVGSTVANVYTGDLPNNIRGTVTIFKLRDKTVLIQTDAAIFTDEYYRLLDTVTFVE